MPTIKLLPKKPKNYERKQTEKRKLRQKAYNSSKWRKLRKEYMMKHPICEQCGKNVAEDIHHIKSFVVNGEIDWNLLLDEGNLKALCKQCHSAIHSGKIKQEETFKEDEDDRYNFFAL